MKPLRAINDLMRHNEPLAAVLEEAYRGFFASGWYILGASVRGFEEAFAGYCGVAHAAGVANGTEALELALRAVGVESGDRVALTANAGGYGTTALMAIGAEPVYVDVDPDSLCMSPAALELAARDNDLSAVIVTHLYGRLADMDALLGVARSCGARVIEDCAQAHGAGRGGRRAGSWGDAGAFSFYPTKNLGALGDGGAVVTSDPEIDAAVRQLRQYGWGSKYRSERPHGRNSRLDELQAALLLAKLPYLDGWNRRRAEIARRYAQRLQHPKIALPPLLDGDGVNHLYVIRAAERASLSQHLKDEQVPHEVHYPLPDYRQPMMGTRFAGLELPVTEQACQEVLTLPCFPEMTDEEVDWVASAVNRWRP